jgi:hypothetical protein
MLSTVSAQAGRKESSAAPRDEGSMVSQYPGSDWRFTIDLISALNHL